MKGSRRVRLLQRHQKVATKAPSGAAQRVVGYLRVSTEGQFSDGFGLDVQERAVRAFALSQGYELVEIITDCVSGATAPADRPGFKKLLDLAAAGEFGVLLLYKFDRLARHVLHAITSVHAMRDKYGIVIRSVTEPIDTSTPMGEMIFTVLASMAAQERQIITERTFGGRKEKASHGGFACGAAPFGYTRNKDGGLEIVEAEAEVIRRIFLERTVGKKITEIADGLNADGIKPRRAAQWWASSVHYVLDNPKYRGAVEYLFQWNGADTHILREGQHDPILTVAFLEKAAALRPVPPAPPPRPRKTPKPLSRRAAHALRMERVAERARDPDAA